MYPGCEDRDTGWEDLSFFKKGDCSGAVSTSYIQDAWQENVTVVSGWAIVVVSLSGVLTLWYKATYNKGGYDLVTYEGIAKVYNKDVNPGCAWVEGRPLTVSLKNNVVRATRIEGRVVGSDDCANWE